MFTHIHTYIVYKHAYCFETVKDAEKLLGSVILRYISVSLLDLLHAMYVLLTLMHSTYKFFCRPVFIALVNKQHREDQYRHPRPLPQF